MKKNFLRLRAESKQIIVQNALCIIQKSSLYQVTKY